MADQRLIDANELVRKVNKLDIFYFTAETDIQMHDCQMVELGAALSEIDEAPTVDAVPVVHGRWIEDYETFEIEFGDKSQTILTGFVCSVCGRHSCSIEPYCHCGAKMDGDENGNL